MTYKVVLTHTEEGYSVGCPELPGCWSQGDTEEEAISNIRGAIQDYVSVQPTEEFSSEVRFVEVPEAPVAARNGSNGKIRPAPFVITPIMSGPLPAEWTSHKVEDLLRILAETPKR